MLRAWVIFPGNQYIFTKCVTYEIPQEFYSFEDNLLVADWVHSQLFQNVGSDVEKLLTTNFVVCERIHIMVHGIVQTCRDGRKTAAYTESKEQSQAILGLSGLIANLKTTFFYAKTTAFPATLPAIIQLSLLASQMQRRVDMGEWNVGVEIGMNEENFQGFPPLPGARNTSRLWHGKLCQGCRWKFGSRKNKRSHRVLDIVLCPFKPSRNRITLREARKGIFFANCSEISGKEKSLTF